MARYRTLHHATTLLVLAALTSGCGSSDRIPSAPAVSSEPSTMRTEGLTPADPLDTTRRGDYYPLASGNRWHYQRRFTVQVVGTDGSDQGTYEFLSEVERVQTCLEHWSGRDYLVESTVETAPEQTYLSWVLFRQDAGGLYEADVGIADPPKCEERGAQSRALADDDRVPEDIAWSGAADNVTDPLARAAFARAWQDVRARIMALREEGRGLGEVLRRAHRRGPARPPEGELLRLRYPLHRGQQWIIRIDPRFAARVERTEVLDLAPGRMVSWRIRYLIEALGPNDRVHVWYGRQGLLKFAYHIEGVATDPSGNPMGTLIAEELEILDDLDLVGHGRFATRPPAEAHE